MNYRIEEKPEMILTGYKKHFTGAPYGKEREEQEEQLFETKDIKDPICDYFELLNHRIQILTEWMPDMGFQLKNAPELAVYHWQPKSERNVQIWMPIEKIK